MTGTPTHPPLVRLGPTDLTLAGAARTRGLLLAAFSGAAACFRLDLSEVEYIDGAGLQILVALRHEALLRDCRLEVVGLSEVVESTLRLFGLGHLCAAVAPGGSPS
ncbi:MAG: STAS domain-containing protein [Lysobacteraceae bacterium]